MKYILLSIICFVSLTGFLVSKNNSDHPFYSGSCFFLHNKVNKVLLVKGKWMWIGNVEDPLPNTANPTEIGVGKKRWLNIERISDVIHMDPLTCKEQ